MEFEINGQIWKIRELDGDSLTKRYNKITKQNINYIGGYTDTTSCDIFINKDLIEQTKIITLKHELTHCYIYVCGMDVLMKSVLSEEVICDIVAASNDFINTVVENYKQYIDSLKCKPFKKDELNILPCRKEGIIDEK